MIGGRDNGKLRGTRKRKLPPIPKRSKTPVAEMSPVAREIRKRMLERGLNASKLAKLAGLGPTYLYNLFSGESRSPVLDNLGKIAEALGCRTEDLTHPGASSEGSEPESNYVVDASGLLPLRPTEPGLIKLWRILPDDLRSDVLAYMRRITIAYVNEMTSINRGADDTEVE